MKYPTALVNAKVLVQQNYHSTGTVTMQGNAVVQGNTTLNNLAVNGTTVLGNANTDTVGFYGSSGSARQGAITDLSVSDLSGATNSGDRSGEINNGFNAVETRLNAILSVLRNVNLISS